MRSTTLVLVATALLGACSAGRVATWEKKNLDFSKKGDDAAAVKRGDELWQGRADEAKLRRALKAWTKASELNPQNYATLVKLARGTYFLADGYLSFQAKGNDAKKKEMLETYEKGVQYAERALMVSNPKFAGLVKKGAKVKALLRFLTKKEAPALYWYATNLGKFARAKGLTTAIFHKDTIFKSVSRVLALYPKYFFGGPDRYFGAYYSYLSSLLGGDVKKSKRHFDSALEIAPNYFGTKVLMADLYAKRTQDRKLFERLLGEVIKGNPKSMPSVVPEQLVEQRKAKELLKKADDIF